MSITKIYSVFCDRCGDWIVQTVDGSSAARREAKAHGWKRIKGEDVCPHCQRAVPEREEPHGGE